MSIRKKTVYIFIICILIVLLIIGFFYPVQNLYVDKPKERFGMILQDGSVLVWGASKGFVVVNNSCNKKELLSECANTMTHYSAVLMQESGEKAEAAVLALLKKHKAEHILITDSVSDGFLEAVHDISDNIIVSRLSEKKYFVLGDILLQVLNTYDNSVTISLTHGEHSFLLSSEVYHTKEHFTYALMPSDMLCVSAITCDYAVYDGRVTEHALLANAGKLTDFSAGAICFYGDENKFNVLGVQ